VNSKLLKFSDDEFGNVQKKMEGVPYMVGVGSLMYAMLAMRFDIAFAMSILSQFMSKASPPHWMVIKHVMRYLKGTLDFKLYLRGKDIVLRGFYNANWTRDANDMQSTLNPKPYMTTSQCMKETVWFRQLLADCGRTFIMCNNQVYIVLAKIPMHHSRTKYINIQHHFIKEKLDTQEICLKYCLTEDMIWTL
jgi:hypothetical protein